MRRRIAILTPHFADGDGSATVTCFLRSIILQQPGWEVDVISLATDLRDAESRRLLEPHRWFIPPRISTREWRGIPYSQVGCNFSELEFQRYQPRAVLTNLLRDYDLIQVVAGTPGWALVARDCGHPIFLQVATRAAWERTVGRELGPIRRMLRKRMTWVTSQLEHCALRLCTRIFVENERMRQWVASSVQPGKVVHAPPGIDTDFFRPSQYREEGHILSVGRFADHRKNVTLLLKAYSRLLEKMPEAPGLVLAGSPPPAHVLEMLRRKPLEGKVEVCSRVSQERLLELYQGASCFALASDEEGFGLALVEAMGCGLPVISTRCGGPGEIVTDGECGILVPIRDVDALASALCRLIPNARERTRMGGNGRKRVEACYSLRSAGLPYLTHYEEVFGCAVARAGERIAAGLAEGAI